MVDAGPLPGRRPPRGDPSRARPATDGSQRRGDIGFEVGAARLHPALGGEIPRYQTRLPASSTRRPNFRPPPLAEAVKRVARSWRSGNTPVRLRCYDVCVGWPWCWRPAPETSPGVETLEPLRRARTLQISQRSICFLAESYRLRHGKDLPFTTDPAGTVVTGKRGEDGQPGLPVNPHALRSVVAGGSK